MFSLGCKQFARFALYFISIFIHGVVTIAVGLAHATIPDSLSPTVGNEDSMGITSLCKALSQYLRPCASLMILSMILFRKNPDNSYFRY